jgi:serine/threonine-protein kinase ATR
MAKAALECKANARSLMNFEQIILVVPSLEHQIRQHESTGRWTSAQSCWEVRLQQSPDNLDFHLGLLRCLRNLGHYGQACVVGLFTEYSPRLQIPYGHTSRVY